MKIYGQGFSVWRMMGMVVLDLGSLMGLKRARSPWMYLEGRQGWVSEAWGGRRYTYSLGLAILTNALSPLTLFSIAAFKTQVYTYHGKCKL
jgi:hypothetical protein